MLNAINSKDNKMRKYTLHPMIIVLAAMIIFFRE